MQICHVNRHCTHFFTNNFYWKKIRTFPKQTSYSYHKCFLHRSWLRLWCTCRIAASSGFFQDYLVCRTMLTVMSTKQTLSLATLKMVYSPKQDTLFNNDQWTYISVAKKKIKSIKQCNEYSNECFFFENNTFYFDAMLLFLTISKRIFIN
jgi:hypothetical protein